MKKNSSDFGFPTEIVQEGKVKVLVPKLKAFVKSPSEYAPSKAPVFYNPVMELNRDIAVLALQAYQRTVNRDISVCEPLTSSGIRGVRFAREVEGVEQVLIGDINEKAFQLAKYNVQMNGLGERVAVRKEDANFLLGCHASPRKRFDVIDVDPFGSPVPFMDSAVRALRDNGLLALTATDMAPLCGVHPKACIRKYGGKPLRTEYSHELAIRLLAGCLATTAAKHEIGIRIIFSHSTDHYIRVYATIEYGAKEADESLQNMGYILHCFNCFHRETANAYHFLKHTGKCNECNSRLSIAGPLWLGRLFDEKFCALMGKEAEHKMFRLKEKIRKLLALAQSEAEAPITYYVLDNLCDKMALPMPPVKSFLKVLKEMGFHASLTHFNPKGIRTNASSKNMMEFLKKALEDRNSLN